MVVVCFTTLFLDALLWSKLHNFTVTLAIAPASCSLMSPLLFSCKCLYTCSKAKQGCNFMAVHKFLSSFWQRIHFIFHWADFKWNWKNLSMGPSKGERASIMGPEYILFEILDWKNCILTPWYMLFHLSKVPLKVFFNFI